jgi:hypothetical protein
MKINIQKPRQALNKTYYDSSHFINTKGRNDLVIHNDKNSSNTVQHPPNFPLTSAGPSLDHPHL